MNSHPIESQHDIRHENTAAASALPSDSANHKRRRLWIRIASLAVATSMTAVASAHEPPAPLGQSLRAKPARHQSNIGSLRVMPVTYHGHATGHSAQPYHVQTYPASHGHQVYPLPIPKHRSCCGSGICTCNAAPSPAEVAVHHMASGIGKLFGIHQGRHGSQCDQGCDPTCDSAPWLEDGMVIEHDESTSQPSVPTVDPESPRFHPPLKPAPKQETPAPKQDNSKPQGHSTTPMPPSLGEDSALPAPIRLDQNGNPIAPPQMQEAPKSAAPKTGTETPDSAGNITLPLQPGSADKQTKPTQPFDALPSSMPQGKDNGKPTPGDESAPGNEPPKQEDKPSSVFDALPTSKPDTISPIELDVPEPDFDSIFGTPQKLDDASSDSTKTKPLQVKPISSPLPSLNAPTGRQVSQVRLKSYRATANSQAINLAQHQAQQGNRQAVRSANYLATPNDQDGQVRQAAETQQTGNQQSANQPAVRRPTVRPSSQTVLAPYRR